MTRTEFLAQLSQIRDHFDWTFRPTTDSRYHVRQHIRAVPKQEPRVVLDPLGALCYVHHRLAIQPGEWARAGEILDLAAPGELAAAANDEVWAGLGPRREPVEYLHRLRRRLETAVGLADAQRADQNRKIPSTKTA